MMDFSRYIYALKNIGVYYDKKLAAGETLPRNKTGMLICALWSVMVYGTSFSEYFGYEFYKKRRKEKLTYMTRRYMFDFFDRYNPKEYRCRIGDKRNAAQYYSDYMAHEQYFYSSGKDAFDAFCQKYPHIFIKRAIGWGGEGARVEEVSTPDKRDAVWKTLTDEVIAEPVIENAEALKKLHPASLNTVNIMTLVINGKPEIQYAMLRMGNGTVTDNIHLGGLGAGIDLESGIVSTRANNRDYVAYDKHPVTGEQILGLKIPFWPETLSLVRKAAMVTPELKYVSWDIAITERGPVLIEGNWDAEFYMKQVLSGKGFRKSFIEQLEG